MARANHCLDELPDTPWTLSVREHRVKFALGQLIDAGPATTALQLQPPALLSLVGRLREALDEAGELLDSLVGLAIGAGCVAGVDALEDDRQLPVAEGYEEVESERSRPE